MSPRRHPKGRTSRRVALALTATLASVLGAAGCSSGTSVTTVHSGSTTTSSTSTTSTPETFVITGRPLRRRRGGRARVARSRRGRSSLLRVAVPGITTVEREALAAYWRRLGEMEHASIAAFQQLRRQLAHLGAPPSLLQGCTAAATQEADHARRCFELASRYAGTTIESGTVRLPRLGQPTLATVAAESLRDGVLNEGYAAWIAGAQAERATDPTVVETLRVIEQDEAEHAALSWQVAAWCLETGDDDVRIALMNTAAAFVPLAAPSGRGAEHFGHGMGDVDPLGAGYRAVEAAVRDCVTDVLALSSTTTH